MNIPRRDWITLLGSAVFWFFCVNAVAEEGYYGVGHNRWHMEFYSKLNRNDGKGSCCNLMDCRPTQSRMVGDHYEVKVDGEWRPVPNDKINNVVAPDGGAHVCAPMQEDSSSGGLSQSADAGDLLMNGANGSDNPSSDHAVATVCLSVIGG